MFSHSLSWSEEEGTAMYVGGTANRVVGTIFDIPAQHRSHTRGRSILIGCVPPHDPERHTPYFQPHSNAFRRDAGTFLRPDAPVTLPLTAQEVKQYSGIVKCFYESCEKKSRRAGAVYDIPDLIEHNDLLLY